MRGNRCRHCVVSAVRTFRPLAQLGSVSLEVQNQSVGFGQFGVFDEKKSVKYGMTGLLDLGAGVTLSSAVDQALNEETGNE